MPRTVVLREITDAVRAGDPDRLLSALHAALDDLSGDDVDRRDLLVLLAPYAHAGLRLGAPDLLSRAAARAPVSAADAVRDGAAWADVVPSAWGFEVRETAEGVEYVTERLTPEEVRAMVARLERLGRRRF